MKRVPLLIFGAGRVGRALVRQLLEAAELHASRDGLRLSVVAWCEIDGAIVDVDGIGPEALRAAISFQESGVSMANTPLGYRVLDPAPPASGRTPRHGASGGRAAPEETGAGQGLVQIVDVAGTDGCIVVDVTASADTWPALEFALRRGYGVATANKLPLAGPQAAFDRLHDSGRFRYESTVGSAVPIIEAAHGLLRAADRVDVVRGAFSGTLGFLFTGLEAGQPFSALVTDAMARGYTEPDPRADLGGLDVARKALILARTLGRRLELEDIALSSLVPPEPSPAPLADFLAGLPALDAGFAAQAAAAAANGQVLRYVAELTPGAVTVGMQPVPVDSAIGRLRGNDNLVAFHTRYYPDEPLVLQGRGAGVDAAAAGVHADIVALASSGLL